MRSSAANLVALRKLYRYLIGWRATFPSVLSLGFKRTGLAVCSLCRPRSDGATPSFSQNSSRKSIATYPKPIIGKHTEPFALRESRLNSGRTRSQYLIDVWLPKALANRPRRTSTLSVELSPALLLRHSLRPSPSTLSMRMSKFVCEMATSASMT
jgi:hypothetical protein